MNSYIFGRSFAASQTFKRYAGGAFAGLIMFTLPAVAQNTFPASGNVGVGTTSPPQTLSVFGDGVTTVGRIRLSSPGIALGYQIGHSGPGANPNVELWNFENSAYIFATNNAERLRIAANGFIGIGTASPTSRLHVVGDMQLVGSANFTGTVTGGNIQAKYQDVAEWVPVSEPIEAGTVVVLDDRLSNHVKPASTAYDTRVAGVVSARPGLILGEASEDKRMIATTGRVKVKASALGGGIKIGDLLVSSDKTGFVMRSEPIAFAGAALHRPGTIVGKALEPLASGEGEILILLSLQ